MTPRKKPKAPPPAAVAHHQLVLLLASEVAAIYRGLAGELLSAAHTLERAQRPEDPYPTMSTERYSFAVKRAAILHHELDSLLKARAIIRAKRH